MSALRYVPLLPLLLAACVVVALAALTLFAKHRRFGRPRAVVLTSRTLLGAAVLFIVGVTLTEGAGSGSRPNMVPGAGIREQLNNINAGLGLFNIVGNISMFVPVGGLIVLALDRRWLGAVALSGGLSLVFEMMQLAVGRAVDIDDVLLNTSGAAVGAALVVAATRAAKASEVA